MPALPGRTEACTVTRTDGRVVAVQGRLHGAVEDVRTVQVVVDAVA